uniref:Uncharacterized protein n=1 Tax=Lotharella globosa TaxID=91324 RepID=A0A7S4DRM3_9EUKA|mmetsp:Transcript_17606/g.35531  ORF Transcript_17606/g.35531 Transcript_17606/m.35531 type:complete len:282 (-) Transcript_17606:344-1189(-)
MAVDLSLSRQQTRMHRQLLSRHKQTMKRVTPSVDCRPDSGVLAHWQRLHRSRQANRSKMNQRMEVSRQNSKLVKRLSEIATKPTGQFQQLAPSSRARFVNVGRKLARERISKENQLFAQRLISKESTYNRRKWAVEFKQHKKLGARISRSDLHGLKRRASCKASPVHKPSNSSSRPKGYSGERFKKKPLLRHAGMAAMTSSVSHARIKEEKWRESRGGEQRAPTPLPSPPGTQATTTTTRKESFFYRNNHKNNHKKKNNTNPIHNAQQLSRQPPSSSSKNS